MNLKLTLNGEELKKLERLQELCGDKKPQTTIRRLIKGFKIE
jgi:hypothetical protein